MNAFKTILVVAGLCCLCRASAAPEATADPAAAVAPSSEPAKEPERKIKVQDRLVYEVKEDPVPSAAGGDVIHLPVTPLGELRFPVSRGYGETLLVKVLNRSLEDVKSELKKKLEADYYGTATVYLKLESSTEVEASQRGGHVFFYGEAKGGVRIPPDGKLLLCDALLTVGYSEWADLKRVKIHRLDPQTGERNTQVFDAEAVLKPGRKKVVPPDFELQDEDRIQVEEKSFNFLK